MLSRFHCEIQLKTLDSELYLLSDNKTANLDTRANRVLNVRKSIHLYVINYKVVFIFYGLFNYDAEQTAFPQSLLTSRMQLYVIDVLCSESSSVSPPN